MNVIISARPGANSIPDGRVPFDEVLESADVISLHCPLEEGTNKLFGAEQFQNMKPSSILINTARGALIDPQALVSALESGAIAAAAIDVLADEPPVDGSPLLDYTGDNLIVTPHIAWASDIARQEAVDELAADIASHRLSAAPTAQRCGRVAMPGHRLHRRLPSATHDVRVRPSRVRDP